MDNVWTFGINLGIFIELNEFGFMTKIVLGGVLILVSSRRLYGVKMEMNWRIVDVSIDFILS